MYFGYMNILIDNKYIDTIYNIEWNTEKWDYHIRETVKINIKKLYKWIFLDVIKNIKVIKVIKNIKVIKKLLKKY